MSVAKRDAAPTPEAVWQKPSSEDSSMDRGRSIHASLIEEQAGKPAWLRPRDRLLPSDIYSRDEPDGLTLAHTRATDQSHPTTPIQS
jgi:hypothetical protein